MNAKVRRKARRNGSLQDLPRSELVVMVEERNAALDARARRIHELEDGERKLKEAHEEIAGRDRQIAVAGEAIDRLEEKLRVSEEARTQADEAVTRLTQELAAIKSLARKAGWQGPVTLIAWLKTQFTSRSEAVQDLDALVRDIHGFLDEVNMAGTLVRVRVQEAVKEIQRLRSDREPAKLRRRLKERTKERNVARAEIHRLTRKIYG